jgi:gamma-tubulin complex component 2
VRCDPRHADGELGTRSFPRESSRLTELRLHQDYLVLIARLEEQFNYSSSFTLQRFWLLVHPALNTLSLVYDLINEIVELSIPSPDDDDEDGSHASDEDSDDDGYGAGLGDVLAELKAASAAAKPASESKTAPWRLGPSIGGETLFLLSNLLTRTAGNPAAHELYSHLLLRASQPYARILIGWISTGRLEDRWDEFCVREQGGFSTGTLDADYTDEYWERRYTLRNRSSSAASSSAASSAAAMGKAPVKSFSLDDRPRERGLAGGAVTPVFLEPWEDMILLAGKYLNVIRECGIEVEVPDAVGSDGQRDDGLVDMQDERCDTSSFLQSSSDADYSETENSFYKRIEAAYTYANKTLLKLLLEEEHLLSRLE